MQHTYPPFLDGLASFGKLQCRHQSEIQIIIHVVPQHRAVQYHNQTLGYPCLAVPSARYPPAARLEKPTVFTSRECKTALAWVRWWATI